MLHEGGYLTWRRFTDPALDDLIGVRDSGVMGDNGHSYGCKVHRWIKPAKYV
jgi:hypothetical protein